MNCAKCNQKIPDFRFIVKKGRYADKPLCKTCWHEEMQKIVPHWDELYD